MGGTEGEADWFQVPYVIFQFPANIVCRKLGPCLWLPSLAVSWGVVTLGVGFTTNWTQLIACRILLGVLEVWSMVLTVLW